MRRLGMGEGMAVLFAPKRVLVVCKVQLALVLFI